MKKHCLALGICLFALVSYGGESISNFVKTRLEFDLAGCPFDADLKDHPEFVKQSGPEALYWKGYEEVSWYTNNVSADYDKHFPPYGACD